MLRHIQRCTEVERIRFLDNNWSLLVEQLEAFIGLCYARGVISGKDLPQRLSLIKNWGIPIVRETMTRDFFEEVLRFIQFNLI